LGCGDTFAFEVKRSILYWTEGPGKRQALSWDSVYSAFPLQGEVCDNPKSAGRK